MTISGCTNDTTISQNHADYKEMLRSNRGGLGGIAGYVRDADIKNCTNNGPIVRSNGPVGGIVSIALNSTITNCVSTCEADATISSGSIPNCGGIVAMLYGESVIDGCAFFGEVSKATGSNNCYYGAISGYTDNECVIKNSKLGGKVNEVVITKDNFLENVAHLVDNVDGTAVTNTPTIENCSYWDGQ